MDLSHLDDNLKLKFKNFLRLNPDIFDCSVLVLPGWDTTMHTLKLSDDIPINLSAYRTLYNLNGEQDKQINLLLEAKILVPAHSQYLLPVILVK